MRRFVRAATLALTVVSSASAQERPAVGGITAQTLRLARDVRPILVCQIMSAETGAPVAGAQVFLAGTRIGGLSDADGLIELPVTAAGTFILGVRLIGYHEESLELDLARGTATQVLVGLRLDAAVLRDSMYLVPPWYDPPSVRDTVGVSRSAARTANIS